MTPAPVVRRYLKDARQFLSGFYIDRQPRQRQRGIVARAAESGRNAWHWPDIALYRMEHDAVKNQSMEKRRCRSRWPFPKEPLDRVGGGRKWLVQTWAIE